MKHRKIGTNGPTVSAIGLGAMSFGGIFGATDEATSLACLDAVLDEGIGISETVINAFCAARGWSTLATALAWILAKGDHLIPIPGTRTATNLCSRHHADRR